MVGTITVFIIVVSESIAVVVNGIRADLAMFGMDIVGRIIAVGIVPHPALGRSARHHGGVRVAESVFIHISVKCELRTLIDLTVAILVAATLAVCVHPGVDQLVCVIAIGFIEYVAGGLLTGLQRLPRAVAVAVEVREERIGRPPFIDGIVAVVIDSVALFGSAGSDIVIGIVTVRTLGHVSGCWSAGGEHIERRSVAVAIEVSVEQDIGKVLIYDPVAIVVFLVAEFRHISVHG